jgi:glycosyltransferase involved in cell wall biosynthesis
MAMNGDDSRSVSVVIATYNRAPLVPRTIENMLAQSLRPAEIIVVDDGSTDETPRAIARFGDPVRYVRQPNRGPAAARNAGLALATGRFIQFMDDDDLMSLNKIEAQLEAIRASGADMAYGPWVPLDMEGDVVTNCGYVLQSGAVPRRLSLYEWHLRGWALILQSCLFTREFLVRIGALREDLIMTEDTEFLNRIFLADPKAAFTGDCLVLYRMHGRNKLTEAGTSHGQKMVNWARALDYMLRNLDRGRQPIAPATRFRLAHFVWRIHREVARGDAVSREAKERLEEMARRYPQAAFSLYSAWLRVAGPIRTRLTGTNWTPPFRPRRVGAPELRLIRETGVRLGPRFASPS